MLPQMASSVHPSWLPAFDGLSDNISALQVFLESETVAGRNWLPEPDLVWRAFAQPLDHVKVVILGQDPYPTPGHSVGLAFSVSSGTTFPRSLVNVFRELQTDLGVSAPSRGDLTPWADQGVLLLNSVLTVQSGASGSHRGKGWEHVTSAALEALIHRPDATLVSILWGKEAQMAGSRCDSRFVISSPHPSPLSARRGFFGSRPFSRTNDLLRKCGVSPIDWALD